MTLFILDVDEFLENNSIKIVISDHGEGVKLSSEYTSPVPNWYGGYVYALICADRLQKAVAVPNRRMTKIPAIVESNISGQDPLSTSKPVQFG